MWLKYVCVNTNLTGWTVLDSVLSACNYYMCLKLEKKYFPQFLFLISLRLALTEGGICVRLEDGSRVETILLSIDWCMDIWRSPAPRSSSPLLVLSNNSGLKHDSALSVEMTVLKDLSMSSFCGSTSAARRVWLEEFSHKLRVAQSSQHTGCGGEWLYFSNFDLCISISPAIIFLFPIVVLTLLFPG